MRVYVYIVAFADFDDYTVIDAYWKRSTAMRVRRRLDKEYNAKGHVTGGYRVEAMEVRGTPPKIEGK
jgi:hypothetical protein